MSSNGMSFFYGSFEHPKGEVYPAKIEVIPKFNDDGIRWASLYTFRLSGNLVGQNPELSDSDVNTRILALRNAYAVDYQDCGFKLNDGTITNHKMTSNDQFNLSGNRVVYRSWDHQTDTEFANTRSFSIGIQALFRASEGSLLGWSESTEKTGTGGPIREVRNTWRGQPYMYTVARQSKVTHVQQGTIITLDGWASPPEPYWPNEELEHLRVIQQSSPRFWGQPDYSRPTHYVLRYKYIFQRLGPDALTPNSYYIP